MNELYALAYTFTSV